MEEVTEEVTEVEMSTSEKIKIEIEKVVNQGHLPTIITWASECQAKKNQLETSIQILQEELKAIDSGIDALTSEFKGKVIEWSEEAGVTCKPSECTLTAPEKKKDVKKN